MLGVVGVYLYFSYAHIYNNRLYLASPAKQSVYRLNNPTSKTTVKYVALGDSLTVGVGSSDVEKTVPYLFAEKLASKSSVTLINLATPGATTVDILDKQLPKAITEYPQYITLWIGVNDIHNLYSIDTFENDYEEIIQEIKNKTAAKIIIINLPYLGSDMLILPPYNYLLDWRTRQFNQVIKDIADKYQFTYIDLYTKSKVISGKVLYSADLFHPSAKGYQLYGEIINADTSL